MLSPLLFIKITDHSADLSCAPTVSLGFWEETGGQPGETDVVPPLPEPAVHSAMFILAPTSGPPSPWRFPSLVISTGCLGVGLPSMPLWFGLLREPEGSSREGLGLKPLCVFGAVQHSTSGDMTIHSLTSHQCQPPLTRY